MYSAQERLTSEVRDRLEDYLRRFEAFERGAPELADPTRFGPQIEAPVTLSSLLGPTVDAERLDGLLVVLPDLADQL